LEHSPEGSGHRPEAPAEAPKPVLESWKLASRPDIGRSYRDGTRETRPEGSRRQDVRQVFCPRCRAEPGERCWRVKRSGQLYRGSRNHIQRVEVARAQAAAA